MMWEAAALTACQKGNTQDNTQVFGFTGKANTFRASRSTNH